MRASRAAFCAGLLLLPLCAYAQIPRITTFFPAGGRAGATVDVEVRGANLDGSDLLVGQNPGISGALAAGSAKPDETNKPLWQAKCQSCHELRSPANRSLTPGQWAATVERMVKVRQAPLSADEAAKVTAFLVGAARAGRVTAQVKIAPDVLPGMYELRVANGRGVSTAAFFEVGGLPEVLAANGKFEQAQPVTLPCVANGCYSNNGEHHYFKFHAGHGQRLVFNMKALRYNEMNQMYFNPDLRLYDAAGKELVENHGYYDLDPLIDWTAPADGDYVVEARDLLGRANPGSVYRLTMGTLPYDMVISPPAVQVGVTAQFSVVAKQVGLPGAQYSMKGPSETGVQRVGSPDGPGLALISPYKVNVSGGAAEFPGCFAGSLVKPAQMDVYTVKGSGTFEVETFAGRLGAPAYVRARLLNSAGAVVGETGSDRTFVAKLDAGQTYSLHVDDSSGAGAPERVYAVEARPARPQLECVARPDNVELRSGTASAVDVIITRREGINGDVTLTAEGLPAGVTAVPLRLPPDRNEGWLLLSAADGAAPSVQPFRIIASGTGPAGEARVFAKPQELYRLNNDQRARDRETCVVSVRQKADFTASVTSPAVIKVHPRKGVPVVVHITRRTGFTGGVTVFLTGLPPGWTANPEGAGPNVSDVTLTVRPDGNNTQPFLTRKADLSPMLVTLEASSDEFRYAFGTVPAGRADRITDDDR